MITGPAPQPRTERPLRCPREAVSRSEEWLGRAEAGLVEQYTNKDGQEAMRLTPTGEKVAQQLSMLDESGQDDLMDALLEAKDTEG